jgi:AAA domain-containing protein
MDTRVCSLAWPSASLVMQVCRRSWNRILNPASFSARRHADRHDLTGRLGSIRSASGCPNAKDLTEWVANGGTRDSLLELIRNSSEWKPTASVANEFTLLPLSDLLARPDIPIDYVVENLLVSGTVSCVVAKPKVGKSTFARNLCLAVSRGDGGVRDITGGCSPVGVTSHNPLCSPQYNSS